MPPETLTQIPPTQTEAMMPPALPPKRKKWLIITFAALALLVLVAGSLMVLRRVTPQFEEASPVTCTESASEDTPTQYMAFQIFTDINTQALGENFPPPQEDVRSTVKAIVDRIGQGNCANRKLAFIVGPVALDQTDEQVRARIRDSFAIALEEGVAVGFHIDDSMFWGRLSELNTPENIEWLDWDKTPNTGRRLDWSATPTKIMPQLCLNSPAVTTAIKARAALIGEEVAQGIVTLEQAGKPELFAGVIAGWETQLGRDFATDSDLGYCALTNLGFSAANPPADIDQARADVVKEFIGLWTMSLADAGVPKEKLYSHIAFLSESEFKSQGLSGSYLENINFTPASVAFGKGHLPGFSTYPEPGHPEEITAALAAHGNPPWISAEGTALDPAQAEIGVGVESMEPYMASFFNHGAVLVNIFGWGVGSRSNPYRQVAENEGAIAAYRKFLSGERLSETVSTSKQSLPDRMHKIQETLPVWLPEHMDQRSTIEGLMSKLDAAIKKGDLKAADSIADTVLELIAK